jgi:nicotinamidase-related amidase
MDGDRLLPLPRLRDKDGDEGLGPDFEVKGQNPMTEHYSVLGPEVRKGPRGEVLGRKNDRFLRKLEEFDAVVIAGQAKSHCVAWTVDDLLGEIRNRGERLARKIYLLEDCASPVVIPGIVDYTEQADAAFRRFAEIGMHVVRSTDPLAAWPAFGASAGGRKPSPSRLPRRPGPKARRPRAT